MDKLLKIYRDDPRSQIPQFETMGAACFDLRAMDSHIIEYGEIKLIPTGLIFDIDEGYMVEIHARSSLPLKKGLTLANNVGIIDSDYINPIFVMLQNINSNKEAVSIMHGERIAQARLVQNLQYGIIEKLDKPEPKGDRTGGFGSTGTK